MHGQNINLPVCVCVSVTLSVNSPTGQTPQRIFTVDSLKDADLQGCAPPRCTAHPSTASVSITVLSVAVRF